MKDKGKINKKRRRSKFLQKIYYKYNYTRMLFHRNNDLNIRKLKNYNKENTKGINRE